METVSGGQADLEYCRALEREVPASIAFLEEHEIGYIYFKQPLPNRNTGGGLGMPDGHGLAIVDGLAGVLEQTDGIELDLRNGGRPPEPYRRTVRSTASSRTVRMASNGRFGARAVVIASGGFEGSREMMVEHLGPRGAEIPVISPGTGNNRGEGISMAVAVGADTAGQFDMFHAEPVDSRATKPDPVIYPYPYGIVVNRHAKRFYRRGQEQLRLHLRGARLRNLAESGTAGVLHRRPDEPVGQRLQRSHLYRRATRNGSHCPGARDEARSRPGGARSNGRRVSRCDRTRRVRRVQFRRQEHGGHRPAQVELGSPSRFATVLRLPTHVRDLFHLRRHPYRRPRRA